MAKDFYRPVSGNPEIIRWQIFCSQARRKNGKYDYHTTVELYDTATSEEALERFELTYEHLTEPQIKEASHI